MWQPADACVYLMNNCDFEDIGRRYKYQRTSGNDWRLNGNVGWDAVKVAGCVEVAWFGVEGEDRVAGRRNKNLGMVLSGGCQRLAREAYDYKRYQVNCKIVEER